MWGVWGGVEDHRLMAIKMLTFDKVDRSSSCRGPGNINVMLWAAYHLDLEFNS